MQARLKVLHDKANVKHVKLLPVTLIGRSTECNLKIASSQVSRTHCRITLGTDSVFVEDLGSANGTIVDGQLLPPHQPTAIAPGASIIVGPAEFQIDYVASTSATMVLSRSGIPPQPELPQTEVFSQTDVNSVAAEVLASVPVMQEPDAPVSPPTPIAEPVVAIAPPPAPVAQAVPITQDLQDLFVPPQISAGPGDTVQLEPTPIFGETDNVVDEETSAETVFMFQETIPDTLPASPPPAAETSSKKGGLKSLFSMFGRKGKSPAEPPSTPIPSQAVASPSVFLPAVEPEVEVAEDQTGSGDTVEFEENVEKKPASDDGFDAFLSQF